VIQSLSRHTLRTVVSPTLFGLGLILTWELICDAFKVSKFVIPRPSAIGPMFFSHWDVIWPNALQTLSTTFTGFAIGVSLGFLLGIALGASASLHKTIFATLIGINNVPKVAFTPLMVLWVGLGTIPAVMTSAFIVIFPIAIVVSASVAAMDPELNDVMRSLGASRWLALLKIGIPQAMPSFFAAVKIAITLALVGSFLSESVAANRGLGYMMSRAASDFDVELVFSGLVSLVAIAVALFVVVIAAERRIVGWAYRKGGTA
jgi:NitT/TauT family transport system permease protein